MRIRALTPALALLLIGLTAGCKKSPVAAIGTTPGGGSSKPTSAASALPTGTGPYDVLGRAYIPYTDAGDPLGFPMKVRNLSSDAYRFWRGSKELFYEWSKTRLADWMKDDAAFVRIHGDLHPGNMGLYHSSGKFGRRVAFGAVDFDDSARLPFQIELLQGVVTFQLLADRRKLKLTEPQVDEIVAAMLETYRASLDTAQSPHEILEEDRMVGKMIKEARKRDYADELEKYVQKDAFVTVVTDKGGRPKELLQGMKGRGSFADAIAEALTHTPDGKDLFKNADFEKKRVEDIAQRTQLESAGSEGLQKYLVLIDNKKSPADKKLILYMKEQIPAAAERVGLIPKDPRPAGQRASEDMHLMSRPPGYFNSWAQWNGHSFRVSIKEPWTETMDGADVYSIEDLKHMARVWGTVAGSLHRQGDEAVARLKARLTPNLAAELRTLGMLYASKAREDFRLFAADPRVREDTAKAEQGLRDLRSGK
jgi:hypothetical protein